MNLPSEGGATGPHPVILRADRLRKSFGGITVLKDVDLDIRAGEVHGLLGANGSGKSTLIKILAGFYQADSGSAHINGHELVAPFGARGLRDHGIGFVHQDLGLVKGATVLEHLALESAITGAAARRLDWQTLRIQATELLERFELDVPLDDRIDVLSPVQRAMIAIVRAVAAQEDADKSDPQKSLIGRILVLDEPTVFLPRHEVAILHDLIGRLRSRGDAVLLVSHDLDEVLATSDRVTVLRNGAKVGTRMTRELERGDLVEMILGVPEEKVMRPVSAEQIGQAPVLQASGLRGQRIDGVDLACHAGEVVGVTGLAGSGYEELPDLLYGLRPLAAGEVHIHGKPVAVLSPAGLLKQAVILIPADRKNQAAAQDLSVLENLSLPFVQDVARGWRVRWRALREVAQRTCTELNVIPPDPSAAFGELSGGNQQKALIGKWLNMSPQVMLLNEPTQGVDLGARREIFKLIRASVEDGMTVLCATSDYEQLVELADRVIVLRSGRVSSELRGSEITEEALSSAVYAQEVA